MSDATSILILTSCTATKASLGARRALAEDLYAGQQHRRLMRGITAYRDAGQPAGPLELHIVSAGRGVVAGDEPLRSYNASFSGMRRQQLQRRARKLGVPRTVASLLAAPRQLSLLLLGDSYLATSARPRWRSQAAAAPGASHNSRRCMWCRSTTATPNASPAAWSHSKANSRRGC
jgi:hypothetical protein